MFDIVKGEFGKFCLHIEVAGFYPLENVFSLLSILGFNLGREAEHVLGVALDADLGDLLDCLLELLRTNILD